MINKTIVRTLALAGCVAFFGAFIMHRPPPGRKDGRPNIVLILADDLGFSDIGCYGGEIHTPNIDWLASHGLRFSQFYNASRCCPSRAALLTGLYNQQAGIGNMSNDQHEPGYRGYLTENTVTLAEVLKSAGYHTAMAGKWHVSNTSEQKDPQEQLKWLDHQTSYPQFSPLAQYPVNRGFEKFYGTLWGVIDYFDPFSLVNGKEPVKTVPAGYYHTDAINDSAAAYIRQFAREDKPFFVYVAENAPHWPVQALPADIEKYKDTYKAGWEIIRAQRYKKAIEEKVIDPARQKLSPPEGKPLAWKDNPDKAWDAGVMAVHAAMVDRMDQGVGRIIKTLKETGQLENTLILFLSDNGASPERCAGLGPGFDRPAETRSGEKIIYPADKKTLPGPETVYTSIGPAWANVANTPYRYWKIESYEGGIHTPLVACWPGGITTPQGSVTAQPGHVMDFMATFIDMAKTTYPSFFNGHTITPLQGISLLPVFKGQPRQGHKLLFNEHHNGRYIREGDWKLVSSDADSTWELYDLAHDGTELVNLAGRYPRRVRRMDSLWNAWGLNNNVLPRPVKKATPSAAGDPPQASPLQTRWTKEVTPANVHSEYPRPQRVRDQWKNLNGPWQYAILPYFDPAPVKWDGTILVPYPVESLLSGVKKKVGPDNKLWYHRAFTLPPNWAHKRILLHFEAVDWETRVWVNGKEATHHSGGYDAFTCDITGQSTAAGPQQIVLSVWNPADAGYQPNGKQYNKPRSIWYTSSTGIWQTIWLEPVPVLPLPDFTLVPDINNKTLRLTFLNKEKYAGYTVKAIAYDQGRKAGQVQGSLDAPMELKLEDMKLWSPANPFLYDLTITLYRQGKKTDEVKSYFGMRSISLQKDKDGITRLFLNNEPLFQFGTLDQGFWPDGLYTAPTDNALKYDIEIQKAAGFNLIRKHVKVEPQRWYYWCDKLGMLVWQDMPSGDKHIGKQDGDITRTAQSALQFSTELKQMIGQHINHPSIVTWVTFNEGWGQFATEKIVQLARDLDPSRLVNATSGWSDRGAGDMNDTHSYPGPDMTVPEAKRATVLGEFGGQALVVKDHLWMNDLSQAPGHIRTSPTAADLLAVYSRLVDSLVVLKSKGLSAAVYTQATDVETEVNGLLTYDREILKMDMEQLKKINARLLENKK